MSINNIGGAIVTLLTPLLNQNKVQSIDQFSSGEVTGYPRIQVLSQGYSTEYLTNRERQVDYSFNIVITQEKTIENIGAEQAEVIMDTLAEEVLQLLDSQINASQPLGGTVDYIRPIESTEVDTIDELAIIKHTITIRAVKTV
jgi:hypothetical protein